MNSNRHLIYAAVYLMPIKDDKVLLLRRFNTGWMDGNYSLIAGHLDGNESVSKAMIREAKEEALISITKDNLIPATVIHRKAPDREYADFFFAVKIWEGEPTIGEPNKCDSLDWFPLNNLPENLLPYVKEAIQNYINNKAFSETGFDA